MESSLDNKLLASEEKRDMAQLEEEHETCQHTTKRAAINKKRDALNDDEFRHRLFTYPSEAAARAAMKRSADGRSKKRSRARSNDDREDPSEGKTASKGSADNSHNINANSLKNNDCNNNKATIDDVQKSNKSPQPVKISRGSIAHIILRQLKGQVRTDELDRLEEPQSPPPPAAAATPINTADDNSNNHGNVPRDKLYEFDDDDDDNPRAKMMGDENFPSGDESMEMGENDSQEEIDEAENDVHEHSKQQIKRVTIRDYVTSQMDPKRLPCDLYKDHVRVVSGPYKGFIGKVTPIGTPGWFMLSTSDGRMATIHSDQMVSGPFHPAAVHDVRRPKLKKDESEYFLEKLSSYIYQSDGKIEKQKAELEDLQQKIANETPNTCHDENNGFSSSSLSSSSPKPPPIMAAQDELRQQIEAKRKKIDKMLANHPGVKIAEQALDPKKKLKR